ncbi:MAG TPA: hypothetical protein PLB41_11835 [Rubrivivax sp.]|nr:hypothetical protein [Rubrivivax sp.]HPO19249.1 hypothetical protein [Rubrivivax sp.]
MVRALLIWLLAFALPLQGAAAAAMVLCGVQQHELVDVAAVNTADALATVAAPSQVSHREHGLAVPAGAHGHAEAPGDAAAASDGIAAAQPHQCSVCAACCSPAAIHEPLLELPVPEAAGSHFAPLAPKVAPYVDGGPERPPRAVLA